MKKLTLIRCQFEEATIGLMLVDGKAKYITIEDEWKDNAPNVSCIPIGTYSCKKRRSHRFNRELWEVLDVPGRTGILIHNGNSVKDTFGCILIGRSLNTDYIRESQLALIAFMEETKDDETLELTIVNAKHKKPFFNLNKGVYSF